MSILPLVSLVVFTFGALSFGALCLMGLRTWRTSTLDAAAVVRGALTAVSFLWFVLHIAIVLAGPFYGRLYDPGLAVLGMLVTSSLFGPLIMQIFYLEGRSFLSKRLWWKLPVAFVWLTTAVLLAAFAIEIISAPLSLTTVNAFLRVIVVLWGIAAPFCALVLAKSKASKNDVDARGHRRAILVVLGFTLLFVVGLPLAGLPMETWAGNDLLKLIGSSIPLYFVFVGTYYKHRITFYDVFVKRGALAFLALVILTEYFEDIAPLVAAFPIGRAVFWIHALALLPFVLATPWLYRRIDAWFDKHWLGRRFTPVEATNYLFDGLQTATTEEELVSRAESRLEDIFHATAQVTTNAVFITEQIELAVREIPIEFQGEKVGHIRMGRRRGGIPYMSEDLSLLDSLAGVISSMLANVRLQARRREQEKLEQELRLHASRSELKALRAQINPHFFFNALNAIAALIPQNPRRAEETVEQLSEVFRYTLTRSDKEWTRLADEVEFVRAYLDVERARFGERLKASLDIDPKVCEAKVPSMMLQTLVENAIKHGLSSVRGAGVLSIEALKIGDRLRLVVRDNGPGFEAGDGQLDAPVRVGAGYGLRNIRERLHGYFGDGAQFSISRDEQSATTVASIELPMSVPAHSVSPL